ncbi:RNA-binding S4 domain-containing protein [Actinotignum urinale]|uniref:RNA-binding S4 domain-containing protein n=1 Tax=Actinotignum urinale TaxID=190146 RepID=A0AAW9HTF4_9ACTO|nr:RNA-binding S4 domain-containing protein [Actinotignum urinale]MDY5129111.1 RNA-binding S4 domain-containing protein [Actinotignum urinale]MDY5132299.1 RNA-binding S4 domain-containing protein [Actinotignum urinale]MDY5151406.1 RNA-binding S4 domain-containing protein [Actinotignum urinale]MDY5154929.1 RNA-binding S4 domain-containing protein [Actinotignum urinale]MDY5160816.1 RNA-binding S4 domain-containing protein [Actinotignum urinale]
MYEVEVELPITLGQFVKLCSLAQTGGEARELITSGEILVNNQVETRRRHNLNEGDIVSLLDSPYEDMRFRVVGI